MTRVQQLLAHTVLEHLSGKWAFSILYQLGNETEPMRFARLLERVEGVSQKVLTKNLRQLEFDGFVSRKIFAEVPPRVEYQLTSLGEELLSQIMPLLTWVTTKTDSFELAQTKFEARYK